MAALEVAGKLVFSQGLASSFRPRKYYTIPKETIEGVLDDLEQLFDFFLLEFQRILFAENVIHTIAVCCSTPVETRSEVVHKAPSLTHLTGLLCRFRLLLAQQDPAIVGSGSDCSDHRLSGTSCLHQQPGNHR